MGFFTLPLARLVGPGGRVVAVDLQPKMLDALGRRAARAGLLDRIDLRLAKGASLGVEDLHGTVDLAAAVHMVHEVPEQEGFLQQLWQALRPGGLFLLVEPKRHVSREEFDRTLAAAKSQGFVEAPTDSWLPGRSARLRRPLDAA
jgi:SAM-dependent methyltransferase